MSVALISNIATVNYIARNGEFLFSAQSTAIALMAFITFIALMALKVRKDCLYVTTIIWALLGILVKHLNHSNEIVIWAILFIFFLIIGLIVNKVISIKNKSIKS